MLLLHRRNSPVSAAPASLDHREARIHALETELACERTEHEAFKRSAAEREAELQRFLADMEMTHSVLEGPGLPVGRIGRGNWPNRNSTATSSRRTTC